MKNNHHPFFQIFFFLLLSAVPAQAEKPRLLDSGIVKEIQRPDLLLLDNGKSYKLAGIRVPADYAPQALEALEGDVLGKKVRIYAAGGAAADRYGVMPAYVMRDDNVWVQSGLISKGLAWVSGNGGDMHDVFMRAEEKAWAARRGFWSDPAYAVKTPATVQGYSHSFQVVEGKILDVAVKNDYAYLNFGPDWKTDFTISLPRKNWRRFGAGVDFASWRGRIVRIRGWVESRNGPMIELTNPEQIEFIKP
ncbi:MAG: thermonuclease family protein [Alphaproteobacteria bacterium]|nr:thermonuclease family protein [Alphaproteobacteria bacterium]